MRNFAKSVLNYFATYTETRFRFDTSNLLYRWADSTHLSMDVLDLAVFPDIQNRMLDCIAASRPVVLKIKRGEHTIRLSERPLVERLLAHLETVGTAESLELLLTQYGFYAEPEPVPAGGQPTLFTLPINRDGKWRESCRIYNERLLQVFDQALADLKQAKLDELRFTQNIDTFPSLTLNPQQESLRFFNDLNQIAATCNNSADFVQSVASYVRDRIGEFVLFDLYMVLSAYLSAIGSQALYLFFHEIGGEGHRYPLFCVEVENIDSADDAVRLSSMQKVLLLNTPAINSFDAFETVLTTPRACLIEEAASALQPIERFLQTKYNWPDPFLLGYGFGRIVKDGLPDIRFRVALQIVGKDDPGILDYSGLLTSLESGAGRKFIEMVGQYVGGNIKTTFEDVNTDYNQRYPRKSVSQLIHPSSQIPLPLNEPQKRILLAAEKDANKVIVVDGPPGTGKSHTITALIYQAALTGKSVLVTSHKQQALDVIDTALTEQFRTLHPNAQPPVLRLTSDAAALSNTLSNAAVAAANSRYLAGNPEAVANTRDALLGEIETANDAFWNGAADYADYIKDLFELVVLQNDLFGGGTDLAEVLVPKLARSSAADAEALPRLAALFARQSCRMPLKALADLAERRHEMPELLRRCNRLHAECATLDPNLLTLDVPLPDGTEAFARRLGEISAACLHDKPLSAMKPSGGSVPADACCTLEGIATFGELCAVVELLQAIAGHEKKFLGGLLRSAQAKQKWTELKERFPKVEAKACESSAADALKPFLAARTRVEQFRASTGWIDPDYLVGGHRSLSPDRLAVCLLALDSLEFHAVGELLNSHFGKDYRLVPLGEVRAKLDDLLRLKGLRALARGLEPVAQAVGLRSGDWPALYAFINAASSALAELTDADIASLSELFTAYAPVMAAVGAEPDDLRSLCVFSSAFDRPAQARRYMALHAKLSRHADSSAPSRQAIESFYEKTRKLLNRCMDGRFKALQNFANTVQQTIHAIRCGRRISKDQARTLFDTLTCVIAEPGQISRHFPMTADLVDYLIIDEASQVSIADSISLMLRAKQVIVFGDDLQYGAVGAINVTERYAAQYFKVILRDFASDMNQALSEQEIADLAGSASRNPSEEEQQSSPRYEVVAGQSEWLKTFSVRTSTLSFAFALRNYSDSLNIHFRSFPEIISYSNEFFYRKRQIDLVPNRIRTKPIGEVLKFLRVETQGAAGRNINLDEIEAVKADLERLHTSGYKGTLGVICSFKEQTARMQQLCQELAFHTELVRDHKFKVWFVGDVQGEERDLIYYSFVQDTAGNNTDLKNIYPAIGGSADNIDRLKMQRLNVGFSRARDTMVFVHSMPLEKYSDTRLGEALRHYKTIYDEMTKRDIYVPDETILGSPAEKNLYRLLILTRFFQEHRGQIRLVAQFEIGKYIRQAYHQYIPQYRVDFLMTLCGNGKERSLIIEYDGVEFHTQHPEMVTAHNFDQQYLEYDKQRQLELESHGYTFLRVNKFTLLPRKLGETPVDVLNELLEKSFS